MSARAARKALIACAHDYESPIQVGDHHLARGLVDEGFEVAFVSNPLSPFHALRWNDPDVARRFAVYRAGGRRHLDGRLWSYVPGCAFPPLNLPGLRSRRLHETWQHLTLPSVTSRVRRQGFGRLDLLALREPRQAFWLDVLSARRSLFRMADRDAAFPSRGAAADPLERRVVERVDLVAYSATTLAPRVEALGARAAVHLPNGVEFRHFAEGARGVPSEYAALPRPIAVYAGSLDEWFDYDLVSRTARRLRDWSFVLIGPPALARRRLRGPDNVHLLGPRPYASLPAYLHAADVGIIPFDVDRFPGLVDSIDPLKLYEYAACGLPVVARAWRELERRKSPALLYREPDEFEAALRRALAGGTEGRDPVDWARGHDWSERVKLLLASLGL